MWSDPQTPTDPLPSLTPASTLEERQRYQEATVRFWRGMPPAARRLLREQVELLRSLSRPSGVRGRRPSLSTALTPRELRQRFFGQPGWPPLSLATLTFLRDLPDSYLILWPTAAMRARQVEEAADDYRRSARTHRQLVALFKARDRDRAAAFLTTHPDPSSTEGKEPDSCPDPR